MPERNVKLVPKGKAVPEPRGPMLNAAQVASELYHNQVSPKWVLENVPCRMKFGHKTVLFYRDDVVKHIESVRESAA